VTHLVGLDVGTTGVKALALSPDGDVLARAEDRYNLSTPHLGWAEQNPEDWWQAAERALTALGAEPDAIGLSGQMHGLVVLDDQDRALRPAILWNDQRTQAECVEIEERVGLTRLIQLTANRALTGFTAPKLLWLRRHEPKTYARVAHVLLPKDYVRLRLTGERAIDVADASGTLLFDVAGRRWSEEMLEALEIDPAWLPRVLESPEVSGETGTGIPVAAGAGDQAAAALGVGVDRPGPVSVVLGTSGVVFAALPAFAADPQARVHAFCHAVPGGWHAMGVMLSAAGSLRWLRDALGTGNGYDELTAAAQRWPPATEGLTFLPYLAGERTPHADPGARGAFAGLTLRHDRGALVRAVLEGVAYGLRDSLELLRELGVDPHAGHVSGGGARSELWLRILAAVLGLPIRRAATDEGSAYGAALLGGVAAGVFRDVHEAVTTCVRLLDTVEPDPQWRTAYEHGYRRFRLLYPALRPLEDASPRTCARAGSPPTSPSKRAEAGPGMSCRG
jgi:xylulokinase